MRLTLPPPSAVLSRAQAMGDPGIQATATAMLRAIDGLDHAEPFAGVYTRMRKALGEDADPTALLDYWSTRSPGNPRGDMRYRWELSHKRGVRMPPFAEDESSWIAWREEERPLLERDPFEFELRLSTPVILTENIELLSEAYAAGDELAGDLLAEASPVLRRDFAAYVQALDPWQDTFALWCLTRRQRALAMLHPLAVAIATCYVATVNGGQGPVLGTRFPFHRVPLYSASAQLAASLLALGSDLNLVASLVDVVAGARRDDGSWGEGDHPSDVLTTLVAADLMVRIDPSFDLGPTRRWFNARVGADGLWRAVGPEAPWLSSEIVTLLLAARQPFSLRFRWPYLPPTHRDHKTRLPFFAYFADLARLMAALPGLRTAQVELGFIDLVGFRAFNNRFGQERGDEVLAAFARELDALDAVRAVRDGGDEFILVSAPEGRGLRALLEGFRRDWPARFQQQFGADVPPVAPRILVARTVGERLVAAREELGKRITSMKGRAGESDGILEDAGELS